MFLPHLFESGLMDRKLRQLAFVIFLFKMFCGNVYLNLPPKKDTVVDHEQYRSSVPDTV